MLAQGIAAAACVLVLLTAAYAGWPRDGEAAVQLLLDMDLDSSFLLIGVTTLGALFVIVPAVRWRLGGPIRLRLQLHRPDVRQLLLAVGAVAPLAVMSRAVYDVAARQWQQWTADLPVLRELNRANALEAVAGQSASVPYIILVVALALGPAIGEEIVFRGLIGPGLIRRWGVFLGILITSVLFAGVHGFPPHAVATLPLACFLHYALLRTGSLWTPIVLHFLNNALALAMLKYPLLGRLPDAPVVVGASLLYVLVVAALLGMPRQRGVTIAGRSRQLAFRSRWHDALAAGCIVGFTTAFVWSVVAAG
jgi:membrane protease YdiL (CAAX protease family)